MFRNSLSKRCGPGDEEKPLRTIEVTLMDSETFNGIGTKINVGEGQTCVLYDTGANITLFQGLIMSERYNVKRQLVLKAYDVGVWLSNNKDSFTYNNKTADQIVRDCLSRLNIPAGTIEGTGFVIGELVKKGTTYWDVIEDALFADISVHWQTVLCVFVRRKGSPDIEKTDNGNAYHRTADKCGAVRLHQKH